MASADSGDTASSRIEQRQRIAVSPDEFGFQSGACRVFQLSIARDDCSSILTGQFEQIKIFGETCDAKADGAVLVGAYHFAGAALAQVLLGHLESIGGAYEHFQSPASGGFDAVEEEAFGILKREIGAGVEREARKLAG